MHETQTVVDSPLDPMPKILRSIPKECFQAVWWKSTLFLLRDISIALAAGWAVLAVDSWVFGPLLALVLGSAVGGMFVIGHDAGHRSFCNSIKGNNFVGHLTTSAVLWPFHVWRLDHDQHHRHTNHVDRDTAWKPTTFRLWKRMPKIPKRVYLLTRKGGFFLGSFYTTYTQIRDALKVGNSAVYTDEQKQQIRFSLWVMTGTVSVYLLGSLYLGGFYGFVCLFLIPQIVFHVFLSTFTYFHHTHPDRSFMGKHLWSAEKAQLAGSLHISYPRWVEFMNHDINWHVPHHVCAAIPHYNLRQAHQALESKYGNVFLKDRFSWELVRTVAQKCHFISSRGKTTEPITWVSVEEAMGTESSQKKPSPQGGPLMTQKET